MKLAKFTYTDAKGKTTDRALLVTGEPSDKFSGIDVSDLNEENVAEFASEYEILRQAFVAEIEALKAAWELDKYRQFFKDKMIDVQLKVLK